jgi:predicted AAA+ superfamily ATPase
MIKRYLSKYILRLVKSFPVISLTGPRQSGKTTLVKKLFSKKYRYVSLEDLDIRSFANKDPRGFLKEYNKYIIFDEIQHAPDLFSYIQGIVDTDQIPGQFILTGSQNFLLLEKISQTLAGRVAILHLLPFDLGEIKNAKIKIPSLEEILIKGFYPRLYDKKSLKPNEWYSNYMKTYIERDIRQIKNIHDLSTFQTFLKMCASRAGQLLDLTSLGNDCGISHNTAKSWLNILEASFIVFYLRPYFKNYNKRFIKTPKLYFYDSGLLCSLLNINTSDQIKTHYMRGGIFESFVISEFLKRKYHQMNSSILYFWKDRYGHEVDCIIEKEIGLSGIEIKSSKTINSEFFKNLSYWNKLFKESSKDSFLIYGGDLNQKRSVANVIGWKDIDKLNF